MDLSALTSQVEDVKRKEIAALGGKKEQDSNDISNALLYAFTLLLDTVSTESQSALVGAKRLATIASDQIKVDSRLKNLKWFEVPSIEKKQIKHHHSHTTFIRTHNGISSRVRTWTTVSSVVVNNTSIDNANAANLQENKMRDDLMGQMSLLQQNSQTQTAFQNSSVDEVEKTSQETIAIVNLLKALTNKILLHR